MARANLLSNSGALIELPPTLPDPLTAESLRALQVWLRLLSDKVNGELSLGDSTAFSRAGNLDAQIIKYTFHSVADTEEAIPHGLGRKPSFALPIDFTAAGKVYISNHDGWNSDQIVLKCDTASVTVYLLVW